MENAFRIPSASMDNSSFGAYGSQFDPVASDLREFYLKSETRIQEVRSL